MNELVRLFFEPREQCFLAKHHELLTTNLYREDQVRRAVSDVSVDFGARTSENFFSAFYTAEADGMGVGLAVRRSKVGALLSFFVGLLPHGRRRYEQGHVYAPCARQGRPDHPLRMASSLAAAQLRTEGFKVELDIEPAVGHTISSTVAQKALAFSGRLSPENGNRRSAGRFPFHER